MPSAPWRTALMEEFPRRGPHIFDAAGNLYGTTQFGGDSNCVPPYGCGTVFKLFYALSKEICVIV